VVRQFSEKWIVIGTNSLQPTSAPKIVPQGIRNRSCKAYICEYGRRYAAARYRRNVRQLGNFVEFALVGFFAQIIDGALGMGFGVISSALLLAQGVPPPLVSASVNAAKLPTSGTSAVSHWLHGNINWPLWRKIAVFGVIGGCIGAALLTSLKGATLVLLTNFYLVVIGLLVIARAWRGVAPALVQSGRYRLIGLAGGTIEGIGGSWGPIVTTGLVGSGVSLRLSVGTSNAAEFVVSLAVVAVLILTFHGGYWGESVDWRSMISSVAGLVAGGVPAAIFGGRLAQSLPHKPLTFAVGFLALGIAIYRFTTM
jgi:uncharacterized membrane protein YfcA